MRVHTPETRMDLGLVGNTPSSRACCLRSLFLSMADEYSGLALAALALDEFEAKTDRNAVSEIMHTATHASTSNQKYCQTLRDEPLTRRPENRIQATIIMQKLRHRKAPIPSFCVVFILTRQSIIVGMLTTKMVSSWVCIP